MNMEASDEQALMDGGVSAAVGLDHAKAQLREHGLTVIEDAFSPDEVAGIRAAFVEVMEADRFACDCVHQLRDCDDTIRAEGTKILPQLAPRTQYARLVHRV